MIEKILAAVDGSKPSEHALKQAVEHAAKWNAELIIVSVVPPITPLVYMGPAPMYIEGYNKVAREAHQKVLTTLSTKIKNDHPDIKVKTRLEEGRPANLIIKIAEDEDVDLIVMGSHGMGGIIGFLGSTSRHVVEACTKPILIVK